jgi:hypothetical protein
MALLCTRAPHNGAACGPACAESCCRTARAESLQKSQLTLIALLAVLTTFFQITGIEHSRNLSSEGLYNSLHFQSTLKHLTCTQD